MKDPKLSSDIIRSVRTRAYRIAHRAATYVSTQRTSPRKGRAEPHEHWDRASVGSYREELTTRIYSMSEEWKKQRGEQDSGTKNQADAPAPQEQPRGPTPTVSSKADNDSDSDIEVLGSPQKAPPSKAPRRDSDLTESKKGPAARVR